MPDHTNRGGYGNVVARAVSTQSKHFLTPEQYLELERAAEFKSEYYQGEMRAMAGASVAHNALVWKLIGRLGLQLEPDRYQGFPSAMRLGVCATGLYTYPDITVVCGEPRFQDSDTLLNPTFVVEVLSPSTEAYDRGRKFEHYRTIPSLQQDLLVASDRHQVDLYTRQADGRWLLASASCPERHDRAIREESRS